MIVDVLNPHNTFVSMSTISSVMRGNTTNHILMLLDPSLTFVLSCHLSEKRTDPVGEVGDYAARALKREVCAEARGLCWNQATRRSRLRAAAVAMPWKAVFASPR